MAEMSSTIRIEFSPEVKEAFKKLSEQLEDLRCQMIDVETAIKELKSPAVEVRKTCKLNNHESCNDCGSCIKQI